MNYFRMKSAGLGTITSTVLGGGIGSWAGNALEQKSGIDKPFERTVGGTYGLVLGSGLGYAGAKGIRLARNVLKHTKDVPKTPLLDDVKDGYNYVDSKVKQVGSKIRQNGERIDNLNHVEDMDLRNINSGYRGSF